MMLRADGNTLPEVFNILAELERMTITGEGWSAESFRSEAEKENGYVLYIMEGNMITALLTGYYAVGEGDITNVAVHPEHRRRGLAKRLIAEFERLLPEDAQELFLEVRESNLPALSLYEKCGFERLAMRKKFYSDPCENAVVMKKNICD